MQSDYAHYAQQLLTTALDPILTTITIVARFMGIGFVIVGLTRLYKMGHQDMMHKVSPMSTVMYLVVGVIFAAYTPFLAALSTALFTSNAGVSPLSSSTYLGFGGSTSVCSNYQSVALYNDPNPLCPMMAYAQNIGAAGATASYGFLVSTVTYALLFVVGVIAFLRGVSLLIKVGDGAQQGTLPKAATHIIGGLVGINAETLYDVVSGVVDGLK